MALLSLLAAVEPEGVDSPTAEEETSGMLFIDSPSNSCGLGNASIPRVCSMPPTSRTDDSAFPTLPPFSSFQQRLVFALVFGARAPRCTRRR